MTNVQFVNSITGFKVTDYTGANTTFVKEVTTATGAGNGATAPSWTTGWTRGL